MEHKTTESIFFFRAENILETKPNPEFKMENTLEGAKENIAIINDFLNKNTLPKGLISIITSKYTKKEIINYYNEHVNTNNLTLYSALVSESFATNFMLGIITKVAARFATSESKTITKVFKKRQDALEWLQQNLATPN